MNSLSQYGSDSTAFRKNDWEEQERLIFAMHWFLDEASELLGGALPPVAPAPDVAKGGEEETVTDSLKELLEQAVLLREMIRVASVHERYCKVYYNELRVKVEEYKRETHVGDRPIIAAGFAFITPRTDSEDVPLDTSDAPNFLDGLSPEQCYCRSFYVRGMWRRSRILLEYAAHMLTGIVNGIQLVRGVLESGPGRERADFNQKLKVLTAPAFSKLRYAENARPSKTLVDAFEENVQTIYGIGQSIIGRGDTPYDAQWLITLDETVPPRLLWETYLRLQHNYGELYNNNPYSIVRIVLHTVQSAMTYDTQNGSAAPTEHREQSGREPLSGAERGREALRAASDRVSRPAEDPRYGRDGEHSLRPVVHRATQPLQLQPLFRRFHSSLKF
jgi:hypothetical protein